MKKQSIEKCYQFFHCDKDDCIARLDKRPCWEMDEVDCRNKALKKIEHELAMLDENKCDYCLYRNKHKNNRD